MVDTKKIDKLISRAVSVKDNSPDVSLDMLKRALEQAKTAKYTTGEALILFNLGRVYVALGEYAESNINLNSALTIFKNINDVEAQINTLSLLGMNHSYLGNFEQALENFQQSLELAEEFNNDNITAKILNNIGGYYYSIDDLESAKSSYLRSLSLKEKTNDIKGLGACYTNLAIICTGLKNIEEATDYINKSIEIKKNFTENFKDMASLAFAKNTLGTIKREEKKYTEALRIYEEVLNIYLTQNNILMLCETYLLIATTYLDINDTANALKSLNAGEQFAKQINASRISEEFKLLYSKINHIKGKPEN